MHTRINFVRYATMPPRLAAVAIICWSLGANTHIPSANTLPGFASSVALPSTTQPAPENLPQMLSAEDAMLYRQAFAAQKEGAFATADIATGRIRNRSLLGHVLADRYNRREASIGELVAWLQQYPDLPEAAEIYAKASRLAPHTQLPQPVETVSWAGDGYEGSLGFRPEKHAKTDKSDAARRLVVKLNRAIGRGNPYAAQLLLETEEKRRILGPQEVANAKGLIAAGYFFEGAKERAVRFAAEAAQMHNPLGLWIGGLSAWESGDIKTASILFPKLAARPDLSSWDRAAAAFWSWRALSRTGHTREARDWLEAAASQNYSFYGFLAGRLLSRDANWSWQLPDAGISHFEIVAREAAGWRALALLQIGERRLAEGELRTINPQGRRDLQEAMLALATENHMPSLALQVGSLATRPDGEHYEAALYPVPPWQPEHGFQIDRALMYALIRHESQFDPAAISGRGACGLMQLMPATAQMVGGRLVSDDCSDRLLEPAYNMALGQKYVRYLSHEPMIGDNLLLLLAAYNGGPNKLARWLDGPAAQDPLLFIESIPTRETRNYVERVLIHYGVYRARLGMSQTALDQLAHGQWPRYKLYDDMPPARSIGRRADIQQSDIEVATSN